VSIAIKIVNLSKQYRLGLVSTRSLAHDLNRWWQTSVLGNDDPYLKIGEVNKRDTKSGSEYVWALRDINIEVHEGEVLGIIGKNGAGKSTLLKILSKVTAPTTGSVKTRGRIASLLEVGTGFHPEMTGRENIYMNGAILGMKKTEIQGKFDEIVDFSGVERYIDTPVKRYSSGMMVRLGFAVAAHLDPEILIIDEVLAIGDAEFHKKAINKIQVISKGMGRTVLYVSHNLTAVNELCNHGVLLTDGRITMTDNAKNVVFKYLSDNNDISSKNEWNGDDAPGNEYIKLRKAYVINTDYMIIDHAFTNQEIALCVDYEVINNVPYFTHGINVYNSMKIHLFTSHDDNVYDGENQIEKGFYRTIVWVPSNLLQSDKIEFSFACMRYNPFEVLFHENKVIGINIIDSIKTETRNENYWGTLPGIIRPKLKWNKTLRLNKY
jgi:lipopolysaccharide transport system ATP-binding protein